jgi:hypothetical protein
MLMVTLDVTAGIANNNNEIIILAQSLKASV